MPLQLSEILMALVRVRRTNPNYSGFTKYGAQIPHTPKKAVRTVEQVNLSKIDKESTMNEYGTGYVTATIYNNPDWTLGLRVVTHLKHFEAMDYIELQKTTFNHVHSYYVGYYEKGIPSPLPDSHSGPQSAYCNRCENTGKYHISVRSVYLGPGSSERHATINCECGRPSESRDGF
jgi:hypothetical protein